ncbi:MAG: ribosome small subunit-dependent GTPase A [Mollicutes bacterium PWAP]|nr:ribosome small subunit-dependent GTPase A [Mollicutes bacterium PWAP]
MINKIGLVLRSISGFYDIEYEGKEYRVRGTGNLRRNENSPKVGDRVEFQINGSLTKILPRKNSLIRPKVSNIDQAIIITSLKEPDFSHGLLNKNLFIIEQAGIKAIIVFTKKDKTNFSIMETYKWMGFESYEITNDNPQEVYENLKHLFKNKITVFTGQTGAGKTTTINSLAKTDYKTQEISKSLGRGKHTTRVVQMIDFVGGKLIDSPGFSSLEVHETKNMFNSFNLFKELSLNCKYRNCKHINENSCNVKNNIGIKITKQFYIDYISIINNKIEKRY